METLLALCGSELSVTRQTDCDGKTPMKLLRLTTRLLGARALYAALPRFPLDCFIRAAQSFAFNPSTPQLLVAELLRVR